MSNPPEEKPTAEGFSLQVTWVSSLMRFNGKTAEAWSATYFTGPASDF
jgi:hypothetical protein